MFVDMTEWEATLNRPPKERLDGSAVRSPKEELWLSAMVAMVAMVFIACACRLRPSLATVCFLLIIATLFFGLCRFIIRLASERTGPYSGFLEEIAYVYDILPVNRTGLEGLRCVPANQTLELRYISDENLLCDGTLVIHDKRVGVFIKNGIPLNPRKEPRNGR